MVRGETENTIECIPERFTAGGNGLRAELEDQGRSSDPSSESYRNSAKQAALSRDIGGKIYDFDSFRPYEKGMFSNRRHV
jgi:hypothetical protein